MGDHAAGSTAVLPPAAPPDKPPADPGATDSWFMLAALLTVAAAADNQEQQQQRHEGGAGPWPGGPSHHVGSHQAHLWSRPGPRTPPGSPPGKKPPPHDRHAGGCLYACNQRYRRQISSATDMRFLHIPREMADALIPDVMAYQISRPGRKKAPVRMGTSGRPVFAARVSLIDQDGRTWPVLFRTYVTGKQYHRRLTDGWRPFAAHHTLTAGDAVHFWRREEDECVDALVMRVQVVRGMLR
jgi:hypothetical protein